MVVPEREKRDEKGALKCCLLAFSGDSNSAGLGWAQESVFLASVPVGLIGQLWESLPLGCATEDVATDLCRQHLLGAREHCRSPGSTPDLRRQSLHFNKIARRASGTCKLERGHHRASSHWLGF